MGERNSLRELRMGSVYGRSFCRLSFVALKVATP